MFSKLDQDSVKREKIKYKNRKQVKKSEFADNIIIYLTEIRENQMKNLVQD